MKKKELCIFGFHCLKKSWMINIFFCEQPHMYLIVWDKWDSKKKCNNLWAELGIGDMDDFDYTCEFEHPTP